MSNRYIYHYCAMNGNLCVSGIAQLTFRITSQDDLEKLKKLVSDDDFTVKIFSSLSFLGMEKDESLTIPEGWALVPKEPTQEMCEAGYKASSLWDSMHCDNAKEQHYSFSYPRYRDMIAVAQRLKEGDK